MKGKKLQDQLTHLSKYFKEEAVPVSGRYVDKPVIADEDGIKYIPPSKGANYVPLIAAFSVVGLISFIFFKTISK